MIVSKKSPHNSFTRLVKYVTDERKLDGLEVRGIPSRDPERIGEFMQKTADQNRRAKTQTYHVSISWPDQDDPAREQMVATGEAFLDHMDLDEHQSLIAVHNDTDHKHIHVVANRIHPQTGKAWNGFVYEGDRPNRRLVKTEFQRHEEFGRTMEKMYGWTIEPGKYTGLSRDKIGQSLTQGEHHATKKTQRIAKAAGFNDVSIRPAKERAFEVKEQLFKARSFGEFDDILSKKGLHIEPKGQGAVISGGGYSVKASTVSREFAGGKLEKKFGQALKTYCQERDQQVEAQQPTDIIDKFSRYFEEYVYDDIEQAAHIEGSILASQLDKARSYDHELNSYRRKINGGFERLFSDSNNARQLFSERADSKGYGEAVADLLSDPERFGSIKDPAELVHISKEVRNIERLKGRYSNALTQMSGEDRKTYIQDIEKRSQIVSNLKHSTADNVKSQALRALQKELGQTESGRAVSSSLAASVRLSKMAKQLANNPGQIPMAAGVDVLKQAQSLSKGEGGDAVEKVLSRTATNVKLAASFVRNPGSGTIKIINRVVWSVLEQTREASKGRGMSM